MISRPHRQHPIQPIMADQLEGHAKDYLSVLKNRIGLILLAALLIFLIAFVITQLSPKMYMSKSEIQIKRDSTIGSVLPNQMETISEYYNVVFIETEAQSIRKRETLNRVVNELNLENKWGLNLSQTLSKLEGMLEVTVKRQSNLVSIVVYSVDREEAAEIANTVVKCYQDRRLELEMEKEIKTTESLDRQKQDYEKIYREARERASRIAAAHGIVTSQVVNRDTGAVIDTSDIAVDRVINSLIEAKTTLAQIEAQYKEIENLSDEELIERAASIVGINAEYSKAHSDYTESQRVLQAQIDGGRGRRHPEVIKASNQVSLTKENLIQSIKGYRQGLATRLATAKSAVMGLEEEHDKEKENVIASKADRLEYEQALSEVENAKRMLDTLESSYRLKMAQLEVEKIPIIIEEYAVPAEFNNFAKPNVTLNLLLGGVIGISFGVALAMFLEYMDTSVKSLEDVEQRLQANVLAVIPTNVGSLYHEGVDSPDAEAYRILRTNIEFNRSSAHMNCLTVVSGGAGEGKTMTITNLATVCAQGGYTTLLIDGDLRRPRVHSAFELENHLGLGDFLMGQAQLEDIVQETNIDNLFVIPSGMSVTDPSGLLNSHRMTSLLAEMKSRFDLVLIDSPPILGVSDASVICRASDLTLVVVQHRKLPCHILERIKTTIDQSGGNLVGVVLNNVDTRTDSRYAYYTSYYTYYSSDNPSSNSPQRAKGGIASGRTGQAASRQRSAMSHSANSNEF